MKRIMAVLDRDMDYARGLAAFANGKALTPFSVIAFPDLAALKDFALRQPIDILLNGTDADESEISALEAGQVMMLGDEGHGRFLSDPAATSEDGVPYICRYQPCDRLFREVMEHYRSRKGILSDENFRSEIIGVCSPIGRCGKTGFAITLGRILAESVRTLYLNLEECSGLSALSGTAYKRSLTDVIYAFRQGSLDESVIGSATYQIGKLDYIAPVSCPEDVEEIHAEELARLAERFAMEEHYEVLILDIGNLGKNAFPLLERCGLIYAPLKDDAASQAKMAEWKDELSDYGGEDLLRRIRLLNLPQPAARAGAEDHFESLLYGELGKMVRSLIKGDE